MVVGDFHKLPQQAKGMQDPDSSLQLVSHEAPSSSTSASKPNEWNDFQAFYKDCKLSKEDLSALYWDYKRMTKPDSRKLSETKRHEEYKALAAKPEYQNEKARLNALCKGRHFELTAYRTQTGETTVKDPTGKAAEGSEGARHLDLHCQV